MKWKEYVKKRNQAMIKAKTLKAQTWEDYKQTIRDIDVDFKKEIADIKYKYELEKDNEKKK